jgi:serine/threonine protein phosphatase PrpC
MNTKIFQLHKRSSYEYKFIQDKFAVSKDQKVFALADGTTQSFQSEIWAKIITDNFVNEPFFNSTELINSFKEYASVFKKTKFEFSSNPAKASLEKAKLNKGGTSTFIGLKFITEKQIEIISCGDSNVFILKKDRKIKPFPFNNVNDLDSNNHFINTEQLINNVINDSFFQTNIFEINEGDTVILATDAISRLILKNINILIDLIKYETFEDFLSFCIKHWENKGLEEDDITLIIIKIEEGESLKKIYPPSDFSFPKEKEIEFIPHSKKVTKTSNNKDLDMNEIRNQFNGVANDLHQVKTKLKSHEILMIIIIGLLLVNLGFMYFNISNSEFNSPSKNEKTNQAHKKTDKPLIENRLTKLYAINRQKKLKKAGFEITLDSIWGSESERKWKEYKSKKK